ncbi:MAG TPA: sigma factor-like helix-turn-helix DNA-binding protein [Thermoanaerobaculia bacterium]|nr:sigma factor-like helix-turn-helix DNA-binding protein [Thermoanaerobaculia bacterium]
MRGPSFGMAYDPFTFPSEDGEILTPELLATLQEELERLPDDLRRCFLLRYGRGFCESEIAVLMKLTIDEVRDSLRTAWRRLQAGAQENVS